MYRQFEFSDLYKASIEAGIPTGASKQSIHAKAMGSA